MRRALALACFALALAPASARAQFAASVDGSELRSLSSGAMGGSVDARFGFRFSPPATVILFGSALRIEPEMLGGYWRMPMITSDHVLEIGRLAMGVRLGLAGFAAEPFAFAHFGAAFGSEGAATTWDLGAALETRISFASIGVHVTFAGIDAGTGDSWWVEIGPHLQFRWVSW